MRISLRPRSLLCSLYAGSLLLLLPGCGVSPLQRCAGQHPVAGARLQCPVPGWTDRAFSLALPDDWDGQTRLPVVVAFHGGGGTRKAAARGPSPDGDPAAAAGLVRLAGRLGFAVVRPDGTGSRPLRNVRTWNAGGGRDGFNCASGGACRAGVDDLAYFDDLLTELAQVIPLDERRVHLTGLSNGGAISHRLACQRGAKVASIAAVGGTNQHGETDGECSGGPAVLQLHGTDDPCWTYEASARSCLEGPDAGIKVGVAESMAGWARRNGCTGEPVETPLPDVDPDDGTQSVRLVWPGCRAAVELVRIVGGGHTWPGGYAYLSEARVGKVARDFAASTLILEFFRAHPRP